MTCLTHIQARPFTRQRVVCKSHSQNNTDHSAPFPAAPALPVNRRECINAIATLPLIASQLVSPATAMAAEPATTAPSAAQATAAAPRWKLYIEREFLLKYPPTYAITENNAGTNANGRPKENPVRAELNSNDKSQRVSVIVRQASSLKQSLTTITDVTKLGTSAEVAVKILPPDSEILATGTLLIPQEAKDTGSVLGKVIERDPVTMYRYEVKLPNGDYSDVSVGVRLGYVYVLAATCTGEVFEEAKPTLRQVADSFKLLSK